MLFAARGGFFARVGGSVEYAVWSKQDGANRAEVFIPGGVFLGR